LIHEFCGAKLKALKTARMPFLVQRKGYAPDFTPLGGNRVQLEKITITACFRGVN
jgi:hypothetical protein